ncbi:hypothetical protein EZS27_020362 [termite gut metagenome]|uniref:PepSY domain-containing protein n=1 Tax=termite gut metagenome TaxID=433724 RepID=A0A5J4RB39_9ZZZZ
MTIKKVIRKIHLWLGFLSGAIFTVICLTDAIWALHLHGWIGDSDPQIPAQPASLLLRPSILAEQSRDSLDNRLPSYISYTKDGPAWLGVLGRGARISLMVHPYSGEPLKRTSFSMNSAAEQKFDFWMFVRRGHQGLWLPRGIGRPVINYATLTFVIVLISGIILWTPKTRKAARNRLWFRWRKKTGVKRKIFDFHAIAGIYVPVVHLEKS